MPLILPGNVGSATATTGYDVANSCRFESAYLQNPSSGASSSAERKTLTWSIWFKRSKLGADQYLASGRYNSSYYIGILFNSSDQLRVFQNAGGTSMDLKTNRVFRDVSAWYHVVVAIDTTQSTSSNRVKIYVNGTQETSFATETYPSQNLATYFGMTSGTDGYPTYVGSDTSNHFYGYMAEVVQVGGSQLDADSFGEFDSDSPTVWKPKDLSDLSFGSTAGANVYLDFEDSSDLGNDVSGGNNDYSLNSIASTDQSTDTCTNNFATLNGVSNPPNGYDLSEGNLKATQSGSSFVRTYIASSIAPSQGKWYWESKLITSGGSDRSSIGICSYEENIGTGTTIPNNELSVCTGVSRIRFTENGSTTEVDGFYTIPSANDIFMYALDLDNTKFYFGINGNWWNYNSAETGGDPTSGSGYVTNSTNIIKGAMSVFLRIQAGAVSTTFTNEFNFGSAPYSISSGNSDGNGYGNFEYSVPSGYYSLNTKNLAEFG